MLVTDTFWAPPTLLRRRTALQEQLIWKGPGMPEGDQYGLPADLEDNWDDIRRSLPRRGRSPRTIKTYRDNYIEFWRWALALGGKTGRRRAPIGRRRARRCRATSECARTIRRPVSRHSGSDHLTVSEQGRQTTHLLDLPADATIG